MKKNNQYWARLTLDLTMHLVLTSFMAYMFLINTGSVLAFILCIAGGIFIDLDHLFDYFVHYKSGFRLPDFMGSRYLFESGRLYLPLHSWEIILALWGMVYLTGWIWLSALASGMTVHMMTDQLIHLKKPSYYSFFFRWKHGFDIGKLDPKFDEIRKRSIGS